MKIDDSIIKMYLEKKPVLEYSNHWIYDNVVFNCNVFEKPAPKYIIEVENCYKVFVKICNNFTFRNSDLIYQIFDNVTAITKNINILLTVGIPQPYDAMVRNYENKDYIIFDLINFCDYIKKGLNIADLIENFLTHEIIHLFINEHYPTNNLSYIEEFDYISFHEGFAHLLSYKENIIDYEIDNTYKEKFNIAKNKLITSLNETNQDLQKQYMIEANSGKFWDKFGAVSSMLYLMKNINSLKEIYDNGWRGYTNLIINYSW